MKVIIEGRAELDTSDDAIGDSPNISPKFSFSKKAVHQTDETLQLISQMYPQKVKTFS